MHVFGSTSKVCILLLDLSCNIALQKLQKRIESVHRNNILIYIQKDATLHSLFYLETALHDSGGTYTHHQERIQLYLQHLVFVTPLLLHAALSGR
jgi:hypothetical protein